MTNSYKSKRSLLFFFFITLSLNFYAQDEHVILISIDGLRPDFYMDDNWPAPNLQRLANNGVRSNGVRGVFPSVTYPSHTSIITGALPASHGIYFNKPLDGEKGRYNWEDSLIQAQTLWGALKKVDMKSAAVMWPVTVGAPIDYNFPIRRPGASEKQDELSLTRPLVTPKSLLKDFEDKYGRLHPEDFKHDKHRQDSVVTNMAMHIFKTFKPNLTAFHFLSMDKAQHKYGRDHDKVMQSLKIVDGLIGRVIRELKEEGMDKNTTVIIVGDHGFVNTTTGFSPNVLLAQHGIIKGENWKAKFYTSGGSAFLYVKDNNQDILDQVLTILNSLPEEQQKLFKIISKTELNAIGGNKDAVLALAMEKGVRANPKTKGSLVQTDLRGGHHGSFPNFDEIETGFIAWGPGVENDKTIDDMGLEDVAPLVAHLLQIPFKAPDGELKKEILRN